MKERMQLTEKHVRDNGSLLIKENAEGPYDRVFVFRQFRLFFTLTGNQYSPADLTDSAGDGTPDYIIRIIHRLAVAYTLYTQSLGLRDILNSGIFYEQGARCICISFSHIPVEHGIASAQVAALPSAFFQEEGAPINCLKLIFHRGLPKSTVTPAHELFHLFQYSYTPFNNVWFMEGLARWSQRLFQKSIPKMDALPSDIRQLNQLLKKWHDAEFFWNRLTTLCSKGFLPIPDKLQECNISINTKWIDGKFIHIFFKQIENEISSISIEQPDRSLPLNRNWDRIEKRSANNNRYIFKSIIKSIELIDYRYNKELENFIHIIKSIFTRKIEYGFENNNVQQLMRFLQKLNLGKVVSRNGILYSDYYEPNTRTLSIQSINIDGENVSNADMASFRYVNTLIGSLKISQNHAITDLSGLDFVEAIEGDLILDNTGIESLNGLNLLERVKGKIRILNNPHLVTISGLTSLDVVDHELVIADNSKLCSITGFNSLRLLKKGGLSILRCHRLAYISGFGKLVQTKNIWFSHVPITNLDFVRKLFLHKTSFPGFIKIESCRLSQISALKGLTSVGSSLYLHANSLTSLEGLENLTSVGASLSLSKNRLENISQLQKLRTINGMLGLTHNNLATLCGLENLVSLKTVRWGNKLQTIAINNNPHLTDISSLSNILTEDRYLNIYIDNHEQYIKFPDPQSNFHKNIIEFHHDKINRLVPTYLLTKKTNHDYSFFRKTTHNKLREHIFDFETDADILILSFSGLNGNLGGMFYNRFPILTNNINTHKIFVNDVRNLWYQGGIPGLTKNIEETIEQIYYISTRKKYKKIICVGTSMGGYMSLLTGYLINATHIIAFAPQIFLDEKNRKIYGDTRWEKSIKKFPPGIENKYLDLSIIYKSMKNITTNIQIHYGSRLLLDKAHVKHLGKYDNIKTIEYDIDDHYITIFLDKQGRLNSLIEQILYE